MSRITLAFILLVGLSCTALAIDFPKDAGVFLKSPTGDEIKIGQIQFGFEADGNSGFSLNIDNDKFTEHFLSMRPFRCIEGADEWFCYLPYPYDIRNVVSSDDLTDLEYNLLFIRKKPNEFGIDAWNGLYYVLTQQDNGHITGQLLEGDLNVLQSPPADKYAKLIDLNEFIEGDSGKRLFPTLLIK